MHHREQAATKKGRICFPPAEKKSFDIFVENCNYYHRTLGVPPPKKPSNTPALPVTPAFSAPKPSPFPSFFLVGTRAGPRGVKGTHPSCASALQFLGSILTASRRWFSPTHMSPTRISICATRNTKGMLSKVGNFLENRNALENKDSESEPHAQFAQIFLTFFD